MGYVDHCQIVVVGFITVELGRILHRLINPHRHTGAE